VVSELQSRGHDVRVFEPRDGWSRQQLVREHSTAAIESFRQAFPALNSELYDTRGFDPEAALEGADVVIVHEWTDANVLARIAEHRTRGGKYGLLLHDTHHRAVSDPDALASLPLEHFDGVLAFGESLAAQYRHLGWGRRVWTWHEAADLRLTASVPTPTRNSADFANASQGDLVWVGNWGDDERVRELDEFLLQPVQQLKLSARVHGVRYPADALARLRKAGIEYAGWIANHQVPRVFSHFRVTVHVPRRPYVAMLPGIPTIRVFEALACGIPLVSAPWDDCEQLFRPGDFLMVHHGDEMTAAVSRIVHDPDYAAELSARGQETIRARHTCAHRVDELLSILSTVNVPGTYQEV
jgi:spore maturation protein CgeB